MMTGLSLRSSPYNDMMVTRYLQLVGMNLMWIVLHAVFWDGNAATLQDVMDSLLSPGAGIITIITPLHCQLQLSTNNRGHYETSRMFVDSSTLHP